MVSLIAAATSASAGDPALNLRHGGSGASVDYSLEELQAMPSTTFSTSTLWTEGVVEFTGVSLRDFLEMSEITDGSLVATAINDYAVSIPVSDAVEGGPIIAYAMNGAPMSRRDKGPLWIVYPFDSRSEYQSETIYSRSIWQLNRIEAIE
ncbi:MAG: molybdopterin-dependent oxidoreductase [Pseudomonadota bacterium]